MSLKTVLNPFFANVPVSYPLKHHKTKGFLVFSGGIKWEHCQKWVNEIIFRELLPLVTLPVPIPDKEKKLSFSIQLSEMHRTRRVKYFRLQQNKVIIVWHFFFSLLIKKTQVAVLKGIQIFYDKIVSFRQILTLVVFIQWPNILVRTC